MFILNIVNSFIGKKGNIGIRTGHIINELDKNSISQFSYSRGATTDFKKNNINMSILGHIPRILNAYRMYINPKYNHRKHDIFLFENFFFKQNIQCYSGAKVAHIWEFSPKIIKFLHKKGYKVILDVPMAPTATSIEINLLTPGDTILETFDFNRKIEIESYLAVDMILSPSKFVTSEIIKLNIPKEKIRTIEFGVSLKECFVRQYAKEYNSEGLDYCFAGLINKRKGVHILLEAWKDKVFEKDRLHLCGRMYPEIYQLIKKHKLKNIITPGFVDVGSYFKKCDVYVFPSILEGSSKSIYEAMNASLPCIVTSNSGSIITNGEDGYIVDILDSQGLKEKMLLYKKNTKLIEIMGKNALRNVSKYSWEKYSRLVIDVYKELSF